MLGQEELKMDVLGQWFFQISEVSLFLNSQLFSQYLDTRYF